MRYVLSADGIREAERVAIADGMDGMLLCMNAALEVADSVADGAKAAHASVAVFCGPGGNGSDGLLAAGRLKRLGCDVTAYAVGDKVKLNKSALEYAEREGVSVAPASSFENADIIIDAIFGIGLNRPIEGEAAEIISKLNGYKCKLKLAVDIPSGLNADTGEVPGVCFNADVTVTFSCYKPGMLVASGRDRCGKISVRDVGVSVKSDISVYDDEDFYAFKRPVSAHKGTAGRVYVIGGCAEMVGAPVMASAAAHAAYLNGAGTVTMCVPELHRAALSARATMAMMKFLPDTPDGFIRFDKKSLDGILQKATAIDIGVGMGKTPDLKQIVKYLCAGFDGALVIDADALNAIAGDYDFLTNAKAKIILTPHVGEFERLTGEKASIDNAVKLAKRLGAVVVLKSATTVITDGNEIRVNLKGTPAMAKGGMGDVLGGCITALACSYSPIDAATVACYRNGVGAERAVSSFAEMMLTADGVLKFAEYKE